MYLPRSLRPATPVAAPTARAVPAGLFPATRRTGAGTPLSPTGLTGTAGTGTTGVVACPIKWPDALGD
ncbi:hypothetical protein ACFO1B_04570 [Dactylosporangium siamense]|uniref:Uncharacterized protein n=1 Tax=Dactylosporangium siamense TaxID=685454 RepID=A0A919PF82_9ACTN|nr:hypothetical protein [Dactylosporangium siamense]GIG42839.1 hypothetical protein Dsi01nite_008800 [Dactylosporangium siamense]